MNQSSIIVVGNAPSILEKELGSHIDSYERVVRFNNYEIEGFEKNVGTKEDIWCIGSSGLGRIKNHNNCLIPYNTRNKLNTARIKRLENCLSGLILIPEEFCEEVNNKINLKKNQWCTTGFYAINWCIEVYNKIDAIGFNFFKKQNPGELALHYFKHKKDEKIGKMHSLEAEQDYFENLIKQGYVNDLLRT